ncbi:hypothetical protein HPB50_007001 [Hyalomma asiaticum]|uniref:Uncharacterized protein n=1 Tax=Hyalomma asiaticum TaxID=266040 RepID=A0ACB7SB14_HYAAI|nr:hypothetical protein HPB50_007001 [Hyalomma asiaticum]
MTSYVRAQLSAQNYVATTADVWSTPHRSFMGVTVHWIDADSLCRKSLALACRRFPGSHTYDRLNSVQKTQSLRLFSIRILSCAGCRERIRRLTVMSSNSQRKPSLSRWRRRVTLLGLLRTLPLQQLTHRTSSSLLNKASAQ